MTADIEATRDVIDIITGGWRAQALYTAVRLGIPDRVEAGCGTPARLARETGADEEGVRRLMRLLVAMGVFEGDGAAGYRGTRVSRTLLDGPHSLRDMCLLHGEDYYTAWGHAHHAISTAGSGFEAAFGRPFYDHLGRDPVTARRFQNTLNAGNMFFPQVPEVFDFSDRTVVDVGGGGGDLLAVILGAAPKAEGTFFDRDHMLPAARDHLEAAVGLDRVRLVGGDMFEGVPQGGDVYILCRMLARWEDDAVVALFAECRDAMADASSRVLVLDRFVEDEDPTVLPSLWDLHLLMTTGGAHRTLGGLTALLERAGLYVERTAGLPMETTAVIAAPRTPEPVGGG
ncbi:methyltransferase [Nocardiopsis chromatogenes]|uniref:methyltransferase n=1 Tax=Nocardiopsis chromatogenes TaxID=280239 RepID=UPI00034B7E3E|nr:methyltransferase [Nocardiopsis chromatogenes]